MLGTVGGSLFGSLAGCSDPSLPDVDVVAGPDGRNVFEPREVMVSVGSTVTWGFGSDGHNVCCRPDDHDDVQLSDGAEPFSSYHADESPAGSLVPQGDTFEHTFDVAGEYHYVCVPHAYMGMEGTILVE